MNASNNTSKPQTAQNNTKPVWLGGYVSGIRTLGADEWTSFKNTCVSNWIWSVFEANPAGLTLIPTWEKKSCDLFSFRHFVVKIILHKSSCCALIKWSGKKMAHFFRDIQKKNCNDLASLTLSGGGLTPKDFYLNFHSKLSVFTPLRSQSCEFPNDSMQRRAYVSTDIYLVCMLWNNAHTCCLTKLIRRNVCPN